MYSGLRIANRPRETPVNRRVLSGLVRTPLLLLGLTGLALAAIVGTGYLSLPPGETPGQPAKRSAAGADDPTQHPSPESPTTAQTVSADDTAPSRGKSTVASSGADPLVVAPAPPSQTAKRTPQPRSFMPDDAFALATDLLSDLADFAPADGAALSAGDIAVINRQLQALRQGGLDAVIAVENFLATGKDVDFSRWADVEDLPYATLRLAVLNTLTWMRGPDALDAMVGLLAGVTDPREIQVLADGLETRAPGQYRKDIAAAARDTLALAIETDPKGYQGLRDLFGVIESYGDDSVAAALENVYKADASAWADYALMALVKLPDGQGVPYLLGIADELAAAPAPDQGQENRYRTVLRMLAQVSRQDPYAEVALLEIAKRGELSVIDIKAVAATLGGWEHELITPGSEAAERFESAIYLNGKAPKTWTDAEIEQRMAMIDQLLRLETAPDAEKALLDASETLAAWKDRPMINGTRIDR